MMTYMALQKEIIIGIDTIGEHSYDISISYVDLIWSFSKEIKTLSKMQPNVTEQLPNFG